MAPTSRLIASRRAQPAPIQAMGELRRDMLVSARWRVHIPPCGDSMPDTTLAGADLELITESGHPQIEPCRDSVDRLALTFWIERGADEDARREVLCSFASDPTINLGATKVDVERATFEVARLEGAVHLQVSNGRPLLVLTQVAPAPGKRPILWCHGCIHELLGLSGGQYRLEEVRVDLPRLLSAAASSTLAREAG